MWVWVWVFRTYVVGPLLTSVKGRGERLRAIPGYFWPAGGLLWEWSDPGPASAVASCPVLTLADPHVQFGASLFAQRYYSSNTTTHRIHLLSDPSEFLLSSIRRLPLLPVQSRQSTTPPSRSGTTSRQRHSSPLNIERFRGLFQLSAHHIHNPTTEDPSSNISILDTTATSYRLTTTPPSCLPYFSSRPA